MTSPGTLERGRAAFSARAWIEAYELLHEADAETPLEADDLEALATSAHLIGRDDGFEILTRAHQSHLASGDAVRAAGSAFWLAFMLVNVGDHAQSSGWIGRAVRLLDDGDHDCVERGYLLSLTGIQTLMRGDPEGALPIIEEAAAIAARFGDVDLTILTSLSRGQTLVSVGRVDEGIALLDEVMVAVTTDDVSAIVAGLAYCAVIETCHRIYDLRRAQEWTKALTHWCDERPDAVPYSGQCLIHRAEIMQLHGDWPAAVEAAVTAQERFLRAGHAPFVGKAIYVRAELDRVTGLFDQAEEAYHEASRCGTDPQPGFALLRLAQGQPETAAAAIRRVASEGDAAEHRPQVLSALVEIMVEIGDSTAARGAAEELTALHAQFNTPLLAALSAHSMGRVLLAEGAAGDALDRLRAAWRGWQGLDAPYDAARARVDIGLACRALGDEDAAQMELDAARWAFLQLGADHDLAKVDALASPGQAAQPPGGLTSRELEVLRLVAAGKSNKAIAADLVLSEKTVARHVSNIFGKLDVSSRSAATAYAFENALVAPSR